MRSALAPLALLAAVLLAGWWAYEPGLNGAFLFDDYANLPSLGNFGAIDNSTAFWRYITSGFADPTGRPLALLTFLLDARNWPADPLPFKRTNVLLHLINGALLFCLLLQLGRAAGKQAVQRRWAAVLGAAFWLLHPLWISTTLYVVQREAMLPATFVLLGLLGYLRGRTRVSDQPRSATAWSIASLVICTALATASKANGLLLPVFVLVLEYTILRGAPVPASGAAPLRGFLRWCVWPIALLIVAYLGATAVNGFVHGAPAYRPWTYGERLLTEPRVLVTYLQLLLFPRPYSRGLFNDDFAISTDLLHPWSTLPSILLLAGSIAIAWRLRRRWPAFSAALLFYFAGHLMESTTIPLELYFEHRNYVPALLLFWPLALWCVEAGPLQRIKPVIAGFALVLLCVETNAAARLWGEPTIQALVWAQQNANSPRAQTYAAAAERANGQFARAEKRLRTSLAEHPDEIQLAVNLLGVRCQIGSVTSQDLSAAEYALRVGSNRGPLTFDWIAQATELVRDNACAGLTPAALTRLIEASWQNQQARESISFQQNLLSLEGQLALAEGDVSTAETKFMSALRAAPKADIALKQAALLGQNGFPHAGLNQLSYYRQLRPSEQPPAAIHGMREVHEWLLYHDGYWDKEIAHLTETLRDDAASKRNDDERSGP